MGNLFGTFGALLFIFSYFCLQRDKEFAKTASYSALNLLGAAFMLVSVYYDWNMGAVINNVFWVTLSVYGLYDARRQRAFAKISEAPAINLSRPAPALPE